MKRALALLATVALLVWLAADGRWRQLGDIFSRLTPAMFAIGAIGLFVSYLLRAARVLDEFRADARARFTACLRIVLIHNAMINVIPFRGGEAAFPVLLRQTFGTPMARAVASLFWFRMQDALVVAVLAAAVWPGLSLPARIAVVVALIGFAWYLPRWARTPHNWAARHRFGARLGMLRNAFADSTRHARYNWSVKLAIQAWLLAALLAAGPRAGAAGALGAELAAILPVQGVAGFGTYEAGAAAALLSSGIGFERGLQAAFVLHVFVIACAVSVGAVAWLLPAPAAPAADDPGSASRRP